MGSYTVVRQTWLSQKTKASSYWFTMIFSSLFFLFGYIYLLEVFPLKSMLPANAQLIFSEHQYWRAWTTQFAHADLVHLLSNSMMLFPLSFMLFNYYGFLLFPVLGIFVGGLINLIVLKTMPAEVFLVGASGLVYWMGATWLALYFFIDTTRNLKRRFAAIIILTALLFVPESYKPEISYLSHFVGYLMGLVTGTMIYFLRQKEFKSSEVIETIVEVDEELITDEIKPL
jgi:rhomboid protease GluP